MNALKKIQRNCRRATFLIEKKQIEKIMLREKLELTIHLAGCSVCRIFEQQSITINRLVKDLFNSAEQREMRLDEEFKKDVQALIEEELDKH